MNTTLPSPAHEAPDATCPACGAPSLGHTLDKQGVTHAFYLCAAGHGWTAQWLTKDGAGV